MTSPSSRRAASLVAALAVSVPLLATLATAPASSAPSAPSTPAAAAAVRASAAPDAPTIRWRDCGRVDCGRMSVPLDHDEPDGASIDLEVARVPARKPARRIGAVFVNPGGPGGGAALRCTWQMSG